MKTMKFGSWIFALILPVTLMGQGKLIPEDDLYYTRGEENPIVQKKQKEKPKSNTLVVTGARNIVITSGERNIDEYNRRSNPAEREEAYRDSIPMRDSVAVNEEGEYINGFTGSESDYEYAERIRRFHNPKFTIHISDPAYTEIYFLDNNDWNVYTDGSYAWVTPTWTNRYYQDYMWSPYSYRPYWQYGWYGSSWSMGWGGGWYDPWYYGGYYPYSYGYWGYPYGCYGGYYDGYYGGYYGGGHHNWGYSGQGYKRYDNGRRPTTDAYGSRGSRYEGRSGNATTRSSDSYSNSNYNRGRSSRYTTVPSTRSGSDSYYSTGTRSGGRSERYSQPTSNENNVRSTSGQTRENTYRSGSGTYNSGSRSTRSNSEGSYTPSSSGRTNYSTGSSNNPNTRSSGYSSGRSSSYSSGSNESRSSSYSTPPSNSSSGSYSGGRSSSSGSSGGSSSGSSSGGGRSSSGGGGRR